MFFKSRVSFVSAVGCALVGCGAQAPEARPAPEPPVIVEPKPPQPAPPEPPVTVTPPAVTLPFPHSPPATGPLAHDCRLRLPKDLRMADDLYVVGIYEANKAGLPSGSANRKGVVDITVGATKTPMTLVLEADEGVHWRFKLEPGAQIAKVAIRAGYPDSHSTEGLPQGTPVKIEAASNAFGWEPIDNTGGPSYRRMIDEVRAELGGAETQFQGTYSGVSFRVPYDAASIAASSAGRTTPISHYTLGEGTCTMEDICARTTQVSAPPGPLWTIGFPNRGLTVEGEGGITVRSDGTSPFAHAEAPRARARCGKHYFEVDLTSNASNGLMTSLGVQLDTKEFRPLSAPESVGQSLHGLTNGTIGVLLDLDAGHVFYRNAAGWVTPGFGGPEPSAPVVDPITGAVGRKLELWTYDDVFVSVDLGASASATYRGAAPFTFPLPEGFAAGLD